LDSQVVGKSGFSSENIKTAETPLGKFFSLIEGRRNDREQTDGIMRATLHVFAQSTYYGQWLLALLRERGPKSGGQCPERGSPATLIHSFQDRIRQVVVA
jgi:hypothetical protein